MTAASKRWSEGDGTSHARSGPLEFEGREFRDARKKAQLMPVGVLSFAYFSLARKEK